MSEPPLDGGPGQPADPTGPAGPDHSSPDDIGAPDDAPRRGAHRAGGRPTPPPPPPAGAPYWPQPDYQPDEPLPRPLSDTLPLRLLQIGGTIALVIILIVVFNQVFKSNKTTSNDVQSVGSHTPAATTTGPPKTSTSAAPTPGGTKTSGSPKTSAPGKTTPPTKKPTARPTAKPSPAATPTTAKPITAKPITAPPPPVAVKAPLLVLNNSRIHGLAEVGKATFAKGGWTVTGTGNYSGRLPETTVFYSPGLKAAAETLARQFPTVTAIEPRPAGVPGNALTVVLTRYFKS